MSDTTENKGAQDLENLENDDLENLDNFEPKDGDEVTDEELEEAGDDPAKLRELLKLRTASRQKIYARAKEAETALKELKKSSTTDTKDNKSKNKGADKGLGYGEKAYLVANGVKTADEMSIVEEFVTSTGKTLEEALASRFVQSELNALREQMNTENASIKGGNNGRGGQGARNTVDYWISKGELPPADQVELRRKVVNEKLKRSKQSSKFASE